MKNSPIVYASNLNLLMSLQASRSNPDGISNILIPSFNQRFGNIASIFKVMSIVISALEEGEVDTPYMKKVAKHASCHLEIDLVRIVKSSDPQTTLLLIMELP
uniref:Uncharacterized protein n=1 Tax=Lactuca sativa TaxID=4236 RepID=A0A9R1VQ63_LACSA|nr:hypothetical protein LSAT_V11C400223090 [Lactuca sativa]